MAVNLLKPRLEWNFIDSLTGDIDHVGDPDNITNISSTSLLRVGMIVEGVGIPTGTRIVSKTLTSVQLSQNATASGSALVLSFFERYDFQYPPTKDTEDELKAVQKKTTALSGLEQVQTDHIEAMRSLDFDFILSADTDLLQNIFFLPWAALGFEFDYYPDQDDSIFQTYTLEKNELKRTRRIKKHPTFPLQSANGIQKGRFLNASLIDELPKKAFVPNLIMRIKGEYFSIRQPDSGLVVDSDKVGLLTQVNVNPTSIDPFRPSTAINNYSATLLDKNAVVSAMFNNDLKFFQKELVELWVGRVGVGMAFSEYLKLPNTYVNKVTKQENRYTFQTVETRDLLSTGAYQQSSKLAVDILDITTIITLQYIPAGMPSAGTVQIGQEFISYTGILVNDLTGCVRGEEGSTPIAHGSGGDVYLVQVLEDNPINLILQLLISSGGGGTYDVLPDGAGIDETMVDIDQFEEIRDEFYSTDQFKFIIGNLASLKTFMDAELMFPLGVRLRSNNNGKIGLALINRNIFEIDTPIIDHDNLIKNPDFSVDNTKVINRLRVYWDWSDAGNMFLKTNEYTDSASIADFGESAWTELKFKGIRDSLSGADIVNDIQLLFLSRFSYPRPQISADTQMSAAFLNIGDKGDLNTTLIPNDLGQLNFSSTLEVVSKSLNLGAGTVKFGLAFTSFSGVRQCYIAPSDIVISFTSQKIVTVGAGRGVLYRAGWKMRLFSTLTDDYAPDAVNEISSVVGDVITFVDDWTTTLTNNEYRIKFADYDDVTDQQKRFCFISAGTNEFADGKPPYQITFG